ncbi:unnamed protein product [Durusdinium trenchii]|uniref:Uncharacterized protein n=1 Tax=Durusdinium trenchii TaxID=1381693 RepID=A0ABP0HWG7_9DINO
MTWDCCLLLARACHLPPPATSVAHPQRGTSSFLGASARCRGGGRSGSAPVRLVTMAPVSKEVKDVRLLARLIELVGLIEAKEHVDRQLFLIVEVVSAGRPSSWSLARMALWCEFSFYHLVREKDHLELKIAYCVAIIGVLRECPAEEELLDRHSPEVDTALGPEGAEAGHTAEGAAKLSCAAEHKDESLDSEDEESEGGLHPGVPAPLPPLQTRSPPQEAQEENGAVALV